MKVWVTRSPKQGVVVGTVEKPIKSKGRYYGVNGESGFVFFNNGREFKKLFGFTPRKGSCKQMELTLTEIEE